MAKRRTSNGRVAWRRRAYFGLIKQLALDEETRHAFNERITGKASTKAFSAAEWDACIEELQIEAGHRERPRQEFVTMPGMSTVAQCRLLSQLAAELSGYWRDGGGVEAFVRARVLAPRHGAFRAERWDGQWVSLWRPEAGDAIRALIELKKQARKYHLIQAGRETDGDHKMP